MARPPKVFLDTNIFKFSASAQQRLVPRISKIDWGKVEFEMLVHDFKILNPNDKIRNPTLKHEVSLLEKVAVEATAGRITAVTHHEVASETLGLPGMDSVLGRFYRAPVANVLGPVRYSRLLFSGDGDWEGPLRRCLESIAHPRFTELQRITGAHQGIKKKNLNQLLDAFYVWCAEYEQCDYFLTLDFKLIKLVSSSAKRPLCMKMATPSMLLGNLVSLGVDSHLPPSPC